MKTLEELELRKIEKVISERIGVTITFKKEILKRKTENILLIESQNIAEFGGVMKSVYETLTIGSFSSRLYNDVEGKTLWMSINFSFKYITGGSNGTTLCDVWYTFEKDQWSIKFPDTDEIIL